MQKIKVGKPFPLYNPIGTGDMVIANISGESFDVICWANGLSSFEIKQWRKGRLHYGVFIKNDIPFFLVDFPVAKWNFEVSIDIHRQKESGKEYEQFLNGQGNLVTLILVDSQSNNVKAIRAIGIDHDIAQQVKDACRAQLNSYRDSKETGIQLNIILSSYSTDSMIKSIKMIQHPAT